MCPAKRETVTQNCSKGKQRELCMRVAEKLFNSALLTDVNRLHNGTWYGFLACAFSKPLDLSR